MAWPRPVPIVGDPTSAHERALDVGGWQFPTDARAALYDVVQSRRDIRRFRPDLLPDDLVERILAAGHAAPSVGHSQPWRFVLVTEPATREQAALMADRERLAQAAMLGDEAGRQLLDLQLEGIRQAPMGVVVCCDRRSPAAGVLGRATFTDADMWSCACAIQNIWLAARAEGVGLGWVTLFRPDDLAELIDLPDEVVPLGWLCLGWPDERPPDPGLERAGWSRRLSLDAVILRERWPASSTDAPTPPASKLRAPAPRAVVAATDDADRLLAAPSSLGVLDRVVDRISALGRAELTGGTLVIAGGRHLVAQLGVTAFDSDVTDEVLRATRAGKALGAVAAQAAGLGVVVVDGGTATGNLRDSDALSTDRVAQLVSEGRALGRALAPKGLVALGEVGIGNTTVAAALSAYLLGLSPDAAVGLGSWSDTAILDRKRAVVAAAVRRVLAGGPQGRVDPARAIAQLGGPEVAILAGVVRGAAEGGTPVMLDGLLTSVAAYLAVLQEPAVAAYLVAGQRSREAAHPVVLEALGLEPLLDLRIRAGEGVGACLACGLLFDALRIRRGTVRTSRAE